VNVAAKGLWRVEVAAPVQTAETPAAMVPKEVEAEAIGFFPMDDRYQVFDLQPNEDDLPWLDDWKVRAHAVIEGSSIFQEKESTVPAEVSESTSKEADLAEAEHKPPTVADGRELPTAVEQEPATTEE
jgi:hypothetical protein